MARKKDKETKDEGNLLDLKALDPVTEKLARHLGYKERVSVRNIERSVETEKKTIKHSHVAAGVLGVIAAGLGITAFTLFQDRRDDILAVTVFIALWSGIALIFARRSQGRIVDYGVLEKVVREKLGK